MSVYETHPTMTQPDRPSRAVYWPPPVVVGAAVAVVVVERSVLSSPLRLQLSNLTVTSFVSTVAKLTLLLISTSNEAATHFDSGAGRDDPP